MNWQVTAILSSALAGDAPMLDALLEHEMSQRDRQAVIVRRGDRAPTPGSVHIPCLRGGFGGVDYIPRCSSPIIGPCDDDKEHFAKRFAVEHAALLAPENRRVIAVGNATLKSYRLPLRVRACGRVCWFVGGAKRRNLKSLLDSVRAIGHKRSQGFGRVAKWEIDQVEYDWSWFAPSGDGRRVLMRPLPWCEEIDDQVIGWRRDFGACLGPYWHPDRYTEIVVPC